MTAPLSAVEVTEAIQDAEEALKNPHRSIRQVNGTYGPNFCILWADSLTALVALAKQGMSAPRVKEIATWHPIESAPKDGTKILVFGQPEAVEYSCGAAVRFEKPGIHTAYFDRIDDSFCVSGATWLGPFIKPTHWQPLPEPPDSRAGKFVEIPSNQKGEIE